MSSTKRIPSGNYTITVDRALNPGGNVTISAHTVTVDGNLLLTGTGGSSLDTFNPTVVLNSNLTMANPPYSGNSGIVVDRGSQNQVTLSWNEAALEWQLTNANAVVSTILTSGLTKVKETTNSPTGLTGFVVITANTASTGQSGLYVNVGNSTTAELVTTTSAKKYALIFG
jgi:hypothetical protein